MYYYFGAAVLALLIVWAVGSYLVVLFFLGFGLYQFRISSKYRLPEADKLGLRRLSSRVP